jgi:hypothetical protein
MINKKLLVYSLLFFAVVGVFVFAGGVPLAAAPADCRIQGTWVDSFSGGPWADPLIIQTTITPQDPAGNRLTYVMRLVNPDVTFGLGFDETDYMSELIGEAVKTGPKTYDFSLIGYGVKERPADRNEIIYLWTINGSTECVDGDNFTNDVNLAVYTAAQDADKDGFPDQGEEPSFCIGPTDFGSAKRIPLMPRCEPPPPEDE